MLSERKHTVLQSLIREYVISAHPVASSTLVRHYMPRLSSATIRNELSWLENSGYVVAPHTSAGRMPTTVGYRTFVNNLLLQPWYYQTLLARKSAEDDLRTRFSRTAAYHLAWMSLSSKLAGASDKRVLASEALGFLAEQNKGLMVFWAPQLANSVIHRGLPLLLSQPEFSEASAALPLMQLLESHEELMAIFEEVIEYGGLHIKIGSEHADAQLYAFSMVAMRFYGMHLVGSSAINPAVGPKESHYGVVAVFGPTRMDYEIAISSVSNLVKDLENPGHQQRG